MVDGAQEVDGGREPRRLRWLSWLIPATAYILIQGVIISRVGPLEYDEAIFMSVARNLNRTGDLVRSIAGLDTFYLEHTPLYPLFLSAATRIVGEQVFVLRLLTSLVGLGAVMAVYVIARRRAGAAAGFVAGSLLAFNPFWNVYGHIIYMEAFMATMIVLAVASLSGKRPSTRSWWVAGVALAVAVMFKEFALLFLGTAAAYALFAPVERTYRYVRLLAVTTPTVVAFGGWLIWARLVAPDQFAGVMERWFGSASGAADTVRTSIGNAFWGRVVIGTLFGWGLFILLGIALVFLITRRHAREPFSLWLAMYVVGATVASFVISLKEPRHLIAVLPLAALLVALTIDWAAIWEKAKSSPQHRAITAVAGAAMLFASLPIQTFAPPTSLDGVEESLNPEWNTRLIKEGKYYGVYEVAAEHLQEHTAPDEIIHVIRAGPVASYYSDRQYQMLYYEPLPGIMDRLADASWVLVDDSEFEELSAEESAEVLRFIEDNFELDTVLMTEYRSVSLYRR